jgi:hypothetical protein
VRAELAAILDMQQQARSALERDASWASHAEAVARVDALDVRALADVIAPSLVASYEAWRDEASEPIQAALFEWSHSDPYALGFGFRTCRVGKPEPILGVRMRRSSSRVTCSSTAAASTPGRSWGCSFAGVRRSSSTS